MSGVKPKLAMESLARIYRRSQPGLPSIEFPVKLEKQLKRIVDLQTQIEERQTEIRKFSKELVAHSVKVAELMKEHEHGVLETTNDKYLVDYLTKTSKRTDTKALKEKFPDIYNDVQKISESRRLKVSVQSK